MNNQLDRLLMGGPFLSAIFYQFYLTMFLKNNSIEN